MAHDDQAADPGANLRDLVEAAQREPQVVVQQDEAVAMPMSIGDYRRLKAQADAALVRLLISSPLETTDFDPDVGFALSDG